MNLDFVYEKIKDIINMIKKVNLSLQSSNKKISTIEHKVIEIDKRDYKKEVFDASTELVKKMNMYQIKDGYWHFNGEKNAKAVGENGKDGIDGKDGFDGRDGKDGKDGNDGKDGKNGINGSNGKDGRNGLDGKNGIDGKDGTNGIDGKDAYELAKLEGFKGSLKEWLKSIEGKDGKNGKDGLSGRKGKDAKVNGYNSFEIVAGSNINLEQVNEKLTISAVGDGTGDMHKSMYDPDGIEKDAFDYANFKNTPTIPGAQIQSDWNQSNNALADYIKNKPSIPSITGLVPYTGATSDVNLGVKQVLQTVATTLDSPLVPSKIYNLGELTDNIVLSPPSVGTTQQWCRVICKVGTTVKTITLTTTYSLPATLTTVANTYYDILVSYDSVLSKWVYMPYITSTV